MNWFENLHPAIQALIATTFTWGITALGALIVCFFKEMNRKVLDTVLGFSAGVMIAASFWSLLSPSLELSKELGYIEWLLPTIGFVSGGLFVLLSDKFLDKVLRSKRSMSKASLKRSILLVSAITIHNIPEGMAIRCSIWRNCKWHTRDDSNRSCYVSSRYRDTKLTRRCCCFTTSKK